MSRRQLSPAATVVLILLVPLAIPALFVLLGPSTDPLRAQELGPKISFDQPLRTSESLTNSGSAGRGAVNARSRAKNVATSPLQKPSGKMEFVPDSPAPRAHRPTAAARSAANSVARRQVPNQPAKVAITKPTPEVAPSFKAPLIRTLPPPVPEQVAEPVVELVAEVGVESVPVPAAKLTLVAKKELEVPDREPAKEPEIVVSSQPDPPVEFSEMPEPPLPDFESSIVRTPQQPMRTLEEKVEVVIGDEVSPNPAGRDVVNLYFEEESSADDDAAERTALVEREPNEVMEVVEPDQPLEKIPQAIVESTPASEIEIVAAQETLGGAKATTAAISQEEEVPVPSDAILAELKPVRSIEIRKAVEVPPLAEMDNPQLREPADQARAMLRKRPPFKFWPVYRDPWVANRDSYEFHHNPLWFEDPNLERCGRGKGSLTSVASFLQFNANVAFLPYRMTAQPPFSRVRTLPDCTVCQKFGCDVYLPPWSLPATAVQGAAIFGFIYAIP